MSAEEARDILHQANAVTHMAIADLAGPQEGHAVHVAASQEVLGAAENIQEIVRGIMHHFDEARRGLNELVENNAKIGSILLAVPATEITAILEAIDDSSLQAEQVKEIAVTTALRGLAGCLNLGNDFSKLGSIMNNAPAVEPALLFLEAAYGMTEALEATTL
jgi:hypothetical protein